MRSIMMQSRSTVLSWWKGDKMKDEIVKSIQGMSGKYSPYQIFSDWVTMSAISIQNNCTLQDDIWEERERQFKDVTHKYNGEELAKFSRMFGMLAEDMDKEIRDWLGEIYMESGCGNKNTGQFFTPWHISLLNAEISIPKDINGRITLNEPSAGGGGMILATAAVLKKRGINYQNTLDVVAQDLDWLAVYMCYVQLSIAGIRANVIQGSSLEELKRNKNRRKCIFETPKKAGMVI